MQYRLLVLFAGWALSVGCQVRDATPVEDAPGARARLEEAGISFDSGAFLDAVERGEDEAVDLFLRAGMDPDQRAASGVSAWALAAQNGHLGVLMALVERGADVHSDSGEAARALVRAAERGHAGVVAYLIDACRIDVDAADGEGWTALIAASWMGRSEVVQALIDRGAAVNAATNRGMTAMEAALWFQSLAQFGLERDLGADSFRIVNALSEAGARTGPELTR